MMKDSFGGPLVQIAFRLLIPFSLVYAIYALVFGEAGPGGGFQAGVVLSVGIVLARLIMGDSYRFNVSGHWALVLAGCGTFIYTLTGWLTLLGGGKFLDYSFLPMHMEPTHEMHALGILMIEIGVTICVMMTIIDIMDALVKRSENDDSAQ